MNKLSLILIFTTKIPGPVHHQIETKMSKNQLIKNFAAVPFVVLAAIILIFAILDSNVSYESESLLKALNTLFLAILPFVVSIYAAKAYFSYTSSNIFMLGSGTLALGWASLVAGWVMGMPGSPNHTVTVHNIGALLGGTFHSLSALQSIGFSGSQKNYHRQKVGLIGTYIFIVLFIFTVAVCSLANLSPPFFIKGEGPTLLRQLILGIATVLYSVSAGLFFKIYSDSEVDFFYWYSLALSLIAIGLVAIFLQNSVGSGIGWAGRVAQYIAGFYFLWAIRDVFTDARKKGLSMEKSISFLFRESETNFRILLKTVRDAILCFDEQGRIFLSNQAADRMFDLSQDKIKGTNVTNYFEDISLFAPKGQEKCSTDTNQKIVEAIAKKKDGSTFPVEYSFSTTQTGPELVRTIVIRNISSRKKAELELKERIKNLNCLYGISKLVETPNLSLEKIYHGIIDLIPSSWQYPEITCVRIILDGKEYKTKIFQETKWKQSKEVVMYNKQVGVLEIFYMEEKPEIDEGPFLKEERSLINVIAERLSHIIERKQAVVALQKSEKKYQDLYDNAPDMFFSVDYKTMALINCNQTLADKLGYTKKEIIGRPVFDMYTQDSAEFVKENLFPVFVRKGTIEDVELQLQQKNSSTIDVSLNASAVYNEKGDIIQSRSILRDITDRKQAREQLKLSLKEKEILLQEIHHRVKNNLQLIISMLKLKQQHPKTTDADPLEGVINRVRIFGDIHRRLYQQEDISRIDFVQHLKENLQHSIKAYNVDRKEIELKIDITSPNFELDQAVSCGLLMNELISNSLKHAFVDQGTISISMIHDSDGELEKIGYSDTGKGIDTSVEGFGTKIIYALAKQLGMSVHISAKDGTRFDFIRKNIDCIDEKPTGEILYVEDEIIIAMDKIAYLKKNGYSVDENIIAYGEKAVKYVKNLTSKPSLILMDIGLKGNMNGIEAAKEIRKENPSMPIIFLSGYEDTDAQGRLSEIPNTEFLNKMSTPEEMKELVDKYQSK